MKHASKVDGEQAVVIYALVTVVLRDGAAEKQDASLAEIALNVGLLMLES